MALTTYTLSDVAHGANGAVLAGARVSILLVTPKKAPTGDFVAGGGSHLPTSLEVISGEDGAWSVSLPSNLDGTKDTRYRVMIFSAAGHLLVDELIQMPQQNVSLSALVTSQELTVSAAFLGNLLDVTLTDVAEGDTLRRVGAEWVNQPGVTLAALGESLIPTADNQFNLGSAALGWGTAFARTFAAPTGSSDLRFSVAGVNQARLIAGSGVGFQLASNGAFGWSPGVVGAGVSDLTLFREAADTLALRRGANPQAFRLYGTHTDAANYERVSLKRDATTAVLADEYAGTGSAAADLFLNFNRVKLQGTSGAGGTGSQLYLTAQTGTGQSEVQGNSGLILGAGNVPTVLKSGGATTTSRPMLDLAQTWNNVGVTFIADLMDITDTASAAGSLLMDRRVGGVSRFRFTKLGHLEGDGISPASTFMTVARAVGAGGLMLIGGGPKFVFDEGTPFAWGNTNTAARDLYLYRDAANVLALRNAANPQAFRLYNTFTDAANYERGALWWESNVFKIGTEKAGTGGTRLLNLVVGGTRVLASDGGFVQIDKPLYVQGDTFVAGGYDQTQTWNSLATAFTAMSVDVTDTASAAASKLLDLQLGGVSKFLVRKDGDIFFGGSIARANLYGVNTASSLRLGNDVGLENQSNGRNIFLAPSGGVHVVGDKPFGWAPSIASSLVNMTLQLHRDADDVLAQRRGVNAQAFRLYNTFTDAANYERGGLRWNANVLELFTDAAGTGTQRAIKLLGSLSAGLELNGGLFVAQAGSSASHRLTFSGTSQYFSPTQWDNNIDLGRAAYRWRDLFIGRNYRQTATWNNALEAFTALSVDVTDTASAADSKLIDLMVGGVSKASVTKDGRFAAGIGYLFGKPQFYDGSFGEGAGFGLTNAATAVIYTNSSPALAVANNVADGLRLSGNMPIGWVNGHALLGASDLRLYRDAANVLALRNAANPQAFRLYNTYTDVVNYERGALQWSGGTLLLRTEASGTGVLANIRVLAGGATVSLGVNNADIVRVASNALYPVDGGVASLGTSNNRWRQGFFGGQIATGDAPMLDLAQTWNNAGVAFNGFKLDITDTASAAGSKLMDLQLDGASRFRVGKAGSAYLETGADTGLWLNDSSAGPAAGFLAFMHAGVRRSYIYGELSGFLEIASSNGNGIGLTVPSGAGFRLRGNGDVNLHVDSPNQLAQRNGMSPQSFALYASYTDSSNYERLRQFTDGSSFYIESQAAGAGMAARDIYIRRNGSSHIRLASTGLLLGGGATPVMPSVNGGVWLGLPGTRWKQGFFGGIASGDTPPLDIAQTWNAGAVTFNGIKMDITDTASAADSKLLDLMVGGARILAVLKDGHIQGQGATGAVYLGGTLNAGNAGLRVDSTFVRVPSISGFEFTAAGVNSIGDFRLARDGADTLGQYDGVNPQAYNLYNTRTDAANYERGGLRWNANVLELFNEAAGTGAQRITDIMLNGASNKIRGGTNTVSIFAGGGEYLRVSVSSWSSQLWAGGAGLKIQAAGPFGGVVDRAADPLILDAPGGSGAGVAGYISFKAAKTLAAGSAAHSSVEVMRVSRGSDDKSRIVMRDLPIADPVEAGALWNDAGILKISAGA